MTVTKKRKPGASIPEAQRHTTRVVLRLPPDAAELLYDAAADERITVSAWVARAIRGGGGDLPDRLASELRAIGIAHGLAPIEVNPLHVLAGLVVEEKKRIARRR